MYAYKVACFTLIAACIWECGIADDESDYASMTLIFKSACRKTPTRIVLANSGNPDFIPWTEKIIFDVDKISLRKNNSRGGGCYTVNAAITATNTLREPMQANFTMRIGGIKGDPLGCLKDDGKKDQCGGMGSCLRCDVCDTLKNANIEIVNGPQQDGLLTCPIQPGAYVLTTEFCMPKIKDFKQLLKKETQDALTAGATYLTNQKIRQSLWLTMDLYDADIFAQCGLHWTCNTRTLQGSKIGCINLGFTVELDLGKLAAS